MNCSGSRNAALGAVMTRPAECQPILDSKAEVGMFPIVLDMMGLKPTASMPTSLTGEVVTSEYRLSPLAVLRRSELLSSGGCVAPTPQRMRWAGQMKGRRAITGANLPLANMSPLFRAQSTPTQRFSYLGPLLRRFDSPRCRWLALARCAYLRSRCLVLRWIVGQVRGGHATRPATETLTASSIGPTALLADSVVVSRHTPIIQERTD